MAYTTTGYCAQAQVQELMPKAFIISATSVPSATQVESMIKSIAAAINAALATGGAQTLPITTPAYFLDDVTRLNAIGVAAQVLMSAFPASQGPGSASLGRDYFKEYTDRLKGFRDGDGIPDEVGRDGGGEVHSYFTDNNAIGNDDAEDAFGDTVDANPVFKMGDSW